MSDGQIYSLDYIKKNGSCQPNPEDDNGDLVGGFSFQKFMGSRADRTQMFQWGFSFLQVFVAMLFLLVWTGGTYLIWLKGHLKLPLLDAPEVPRGWKSVMFLGQTIAKELSESGLDPHAMSEAELGRIIQAKLKGGSVTLEGSEEGRKRNVRRGIVNYMRFNLRWCAISAAVLVLAITITTMPVASSGGEAWFFFHVWFWCLFSGLVVTPYLFGTSRGRLFVMLCFALTTMVIIAVTAVYAETIAL